MSVLCEAISVIVPIDVLRAKYAGGPAAYERAAPEETFCADDVLTRVGFADADGLESHLKGLRDHHLIETVGGAFAEYAVVHEHDGPTLPCPWLAWERREDVTRAWLVGHAEGELATPAGPRRG